MKITANSFFSPFCLNKKIIEKEQLKIQILAKRVFTTLKNYQKEILTFSAVIISGYFIGNLLGSSLKMEKEPASDLFNESQFDSFDWDLQLFNLGAAALFASCIPTTYIVPPFLLVVVLDFISQS